MVAGSIRPGSPISSIGSTVLPAPPEDDELDELDEDELEEELEVEVAAVAVVTETFVVRGDQLPAASRARTL
jgi:hypothetical protein